MKTYLLLAILTVSMAACNENGTKQNGQLQKQPDSVIYNMHRGTDLLDHTLVQIYVEPNLDIYKEGDTVWTNRSYVIAPKSELTPCHVVVGSFILKVKRPLVIYVGDAFGRK